MSTSTVRPAPQDLGALEMRSAGVCAQWRRPQERT